MKKRLILLLCLVLLAACGRQGGSGEPELSPAYENFPFGGDYTSCSIGDRVYSLYYGFHIYDAQSDSVRRGLCRDPLCAHDSESCPDYLLKRSSGFPGMATDGKKLFFSTAFFETDGKTGQSERHRAVYAVDPIGGKVCRVCEVPTTGAEYAGLIYADGSLWIMGAYYDEDFDPSSGAADYGDQYAKILRVRTFGGSPESVSEERFDIDDAFFTDGTTLWAEGRSTGTLRCCPLENGKTAGQWTDCLPDGMHAGPMCVYEGKVYLITSPASPKDAKGAYTDVSGRTLCPLSVFRLNGGEWEMTADDVTFWSYRFAGGALWYEPFAAESYGVRDSWNGRETVPTEWVKNGTGVLRRLDLADGSVCEWVSEDGRSIHPLAVCKNDGGVIVWALLEDYAAYVESDGERDTEIWKLTLCEDGIAGRALSAGDLLE